MVKSGNNSNSSDEESTEEKRDAYKRQNRKEQKSNRKRKSSSRSSSSSSSANNAPISRRKDRDDSQKYEKSRHDRERNTKDNAKCSSKWDSPKDRSRRSRSTSRRRNSYRDRKSEDFRGDRDRGRYRSEQTRDNRSDRYRGKHRDVDQNERKRYSRSRSPRRDNWKRTEYPRERKSFKREKFDKDDKKYEWGKIEKRERDADSSKPVEKEKPNFGLSGALTEDTNKVNGVVVKYAEPPEARKPKRRWRLYPFKGETALPTLHIHRQSCFLVGRERKVVDIAVDHPSCSKQHAALQYRLVPFEREDGTQGKRVRLYLIDLESANGTYLNNKKIDPRRYYELVEKDVIKFGYSTREYVLLHENSQEDQEDDDVKVKTEDAEEPPGI